MADETHIIRITVQGEDKLGPSAKKATSDLSSLANVAKGIAASAVVKYAKQAAAAAAETVKLGAQSLAAKDRLIAFAGGASQAEEMMNALIDGSDRTIDRMSAMSRASLLIEQGLVSNAQQMSLAGAAVSKLGNQTWSVERRMSSLTSLLANQSTRRLDDFGVSVEKVRSRQKELEEQGMATEAAFSAAFFEQVAEKVEVLGDTSATAATQTAQLEASWETLKQTWAEASAEAAASTGILAAVSAAIDDVTQATRDYNEGIAKAVELGIANLEVADLYAEMYTSAAAATENWQQDEDELRATLEETNAALAEQTALTARQIAVEEALAQEDERRIANAKRRQELALQIVADEVRHQEAERERQNQIEEATRNHQERLNSIWQSGQKSRTEIAQEAHQERLQALNDAMQAELAALAASIEERNFNERVESMERQHQRRIESIRNQGRETDKQREDNRFRDVMDNLNDEQQARLRALRQRHGKDVSAADERESLEEEHRRRMAGLFTDSARAAEVRRHQEAVKELDFQTEEADLLEQFEREKEAKEKEHAENLAQIDQERINRAIQAENERFQREVEQANQARAQQQADMAARQAIEQQFAQQQAELERNLAFEIAAIEQEALNQRIAQEEAAHQRRLEKLGVFQAEMNRRAAETPVVIPVGIAPDPNVQVHWEEILRQQGIPGFARGGVSAGGLAVVGEEGPELLDLPGGTAISPLSRGGAAPAGASVTVINHFGADSVRSERDIRRIMEQQEKSLRLRGIGGLN
jgi:hypothetical protein